MYCFTEFDDKNCPLQVQTLLTSLSGTPIMLTGGKFFALHRPFLLTIMGITVTYFVVMVQMINP